jgi:hypothetical protein
MKRSLWTGMRRSIHTAMRSSLALLPREPRFAVYRSLIDCDASPGARLELSIAAQREDLETCFRLLHDAYVASGFMQPHPSGMRVTPYHALPTTTTLMAKFDGEVVGTLSIIREGVFGFPMQTAFDLTPVRSRSGRIAEISALAVHRRFRSTGGRILFPLMKFMYEYCTRFFDTRHLVIAVNPNKIELYESLLFFERLTQQVVPSYDFANGAPAVGATLDLHAAPEIFRRAYDGKRAGKNLYRYFTQVALPQIRFPERPYFTTTDPVMSPELLDHFFNRCTTVFASLDDRRRRLLRSVYRGDAYAGVLPSPAGACGGARLRRHRRYSMKCPARLETVKSGLQSLPIEVFDISLHGFLARSDSALAERLRGVACVQLGEQSTATVEATVIRQVRSEAGLFYGFRVENPDVAWQRCILELEAREKRIAGLEPADAPEAHSHTGTGALDPLPA